MKGDAQPLTKFFDGADKRFIIPLYQRNYDWKEENCEQLFRDLIKLHNSKRRSHFFGSIVSNIQPGTEDRYIIDGQQRITTVSLMLIAMVNLKKAGLIKAANSKLEEKIFTCYLVDEYQEDERKVKLKPIKKDMEAFDALLYKPREKYVKESNVTRNYEFFVDKIKGCGLTLDELFETIKKLEVINIRLDEDDDPQLIFESLNSTGLDLSEADKIRNYLLMSLAPMEQENLYTRYWNPIEEYTKYEPSSFVRDYLTMQQGKIGQIDRIYFIFKEYAEKEYAEGLDNRVALLEKMHHYARIYYQIDNAQIGAEKLNRKLSELQILNSTVAYPFFMAFFDYAAKEKMPDNEIYKVLDVIEAYWARRIICNMPSNALNKVFATLHKDVFNHIQKARNKNIPTYSDVLIYVLLKKGASSAFPSDEEVKGNFISRQVYKMPTNQRMFILERMENRDNNERHDVVKELTDKNITIEHIMPQTLSEKWKKALGDEWERIHQQYLHTMANLTLTGYNSQYSNLTFVEKRDMEKGFKDSALRLNNDVKSCEQWTETELKQRQQNLLDVFFHLWPMPTTNFEITKQEAESASLDDEDSDLFTGKKLQAYILYGVRNVVNTWKEMLVQVCKHILLEKRSTIEWLCANENTRGFYTQPESWRRELAPNMYVWTDNSTTTKISILKTLFTECNIPFSELVFEFRSDRDEEGEEEL